MLDVLQFFTEQDKDDSGHFEVGDMAEQQKEWVAPLQQAKPKPKPSQSSPAPRRLKTPPTEAPPNIQNLSTAVSSSESGSSDDNAPAVCFVLVNNHGVNPVTIISLATSQTVALNSTYTPYATKS